MKAAAAHSPSISRRIIYQIYDVLIAQFPEGGYMTNLYGVTHAAESIQQDVFEVKRFKLQSNEIAQSQTAPLRMLMPYLRKALKHAKIPQ
jgi:hypothetical protein